MLNAERGMQKCGWSLLIVGWIVGDIRAAERTPDAPTTMTTRGGLLLRDDFDTPPAKPWEIAEPTWETVDGALRATHRLPWPDNHGPVMRRALGFGNVIVQCSIKLEGKARAVVHLNKESGHLCRALIGPDLFTIVRRDSGGDKGVRLAERAMAVEPGVWHTLVIELYGTELLATLDGKTTIVGKRSDLAVPKTSIILEASAGTACFKDLRVWESQPRPEWPIDRTSAKPRAPNVVLIMADDLGYGDLGCYGAMKIATPHCDRLAREGRRFTDAHTPAASCSPTRFGLLTGCYPWRENRVPGALNANESYKLRDGETTIASMLKEAGYATACIGKWHLGAQRKRPIDFNRPLTPGPNDAGFDYYFGVINSHNQPPFVLVENDCIVGLEPGERVAIEGERKQTEGRRLRDENTLEATQAARAVEFIEQHRDRPFFLYYPTAAVHDPYTPGEMWKGKSHAGIYGDYVQEFDWAVGEVIAALDRFGLADNTIIVVTSDNGGQQGRGSQFGHKCNGDLRGCKGTAWEGGHRVPFIVCWPDKIPAGTTSGETICHVDVMATLCAALGIPLATHAGPDSWNMLPAWLGSESADGPLREGTICLGRSIYTIRQGPWKLVLEGSDKSRPSGGDTGAELFNLADDLGETTNVAPSYPDRVRQLKALLQQYRAQGYSRPGWKASARSTNSFMDTPSRNISR